MKQTAAMVSVVGVFLIGILVGALGMQVYHNNRPVPGPGGGPGMERRLKFAERLGSLLELTEEQREEIGTIRHESRIRAEAMRRKMEPVFARKRNLPSAAAFWWAESRSGEDALP